MLNMIGTSSLGIIISWDAKDLQDRSVMNMVNMSFMVMDMASQVNVRVLSILS
jgi:hypothetical protein